MEILVRAEQGPKTAWIDTLAYTKKKSASPSRHIVYWGTDLSELWKPLRLDIVQVAANTKFSLDDLGY
jgi:hypothetical protein